MIKVERKQKIMWKLNPTVFEVMNKDVLYSNTRPLGTSVSAVNKMTSATEEMRAYLPELVGASPDNTSVDWQGKVESYWREFHLEVPTEGYNMDTSYEIHCYGKYKANIEKYLKEKSKKFANDEEAEELIKGYLEAYTSDGIKVIPEQELHRYARPTNIKEYLTWRYCLVSPAVANRPEDVDKSPNIRFYLHDAESQAKKDKERSNLFKNALMKYNKLITENSDKATYANILLVYGNVDFHKLKAMTLDDCQMMVGKMPYEKPQTFLDAIEDTLITDKATILRYINVGLLRKLDNSNSIIDSTTLIPLGANLIDAVAYMKDEANNTYVAELKAKYAAIPKK